MSKPYVGQLTMTCPVGGEEWPITSYKAMVDTAHDGYIMPKHVKMYCPAEHYFTLATISREKTLCRKDIRRVLDGATEVYKQHKKNRS